MTRREQHGLGCAGIWDDLLASADSEWLDFVASQEAEREPWQDVALRGGFPTPAVHMTERRERAIWFDGYVRTMMVR